MTESRPSSAGAGGAGPEGGDVPWRRLHPASLLVNLVPTAWRTFLRVWPLLLALVVGRSVQGVLDLGLIALFFMMAVLRTVLHFATLRYRFAAGRLEIHYGLFGRVHRALSPERIQNVAVVQNVFHKLAGLVELRIEMAGDTGLAAADGLLSALSIEEAEFLRSQLGRPGSHVAAPRGEVEAIDSAGLLEVVAYGMSAGRVGTAAVAVGVLLDLANNLAPGSMALRPENLGPFAMVGLALLALAGGYLLSVGAAVLRWYGHQWWRDGDHLHFESGLLTRRRMDIPLRKLQLVQASEPLVRRAMGFASLLLDTAALAGPTTRDSVATEGYVPMVDRAHLVERIREAFPGLDTPIDGDLQPCAPQAVARAVVGGALRTAVVCVPLGAVLHQPGFWALPLLAGAVGFLDGRRQGWQLTPKFIVVRRGFLSRDTWVLPRDKVQSVRMEEGPVQRAVGLGRVVIWFPGGRLPLPEVQAADARAAFASLRDRR